MAINKSFIRKSRVATTIPDSSLADIAFLLLIFFMVSTSFRVEDRREVVQPDAAATQKVDEKRKNVLHIWIEGDGGIFLNDQRLPPANVAGTVQRLYDESGRQLVVAIRADRDASYRAVDEVTEALRAAGALRVNFATHFADRTATLR